MNSPTTSPIIVLAGGRGTRFLEVDELTQKVIFDIKGRPFISYLLESYLYLFREVIFSLGDRAKSIIPFCDKYSVEKEPLGTGGGTLNTFEEHNLNYAYVTNGDTYLDFSSDTNFSVDDKSTIFLVKKDSIDNEKGGVDVKDEYVSGFFEKEGRGEFFNTGLYYLKKEDLLHFNGAFSLEHDLFPLLVEKKKLKYKIIDAKIYDIGSKKGLEKFKTSYVK